MAESVWAFDIKSLEQYKLSFDDMGDLISVSRFGPPNESGKPGQEILVPPKDTQIVLAELSKIGPDGDCTLSGDAYSISVDKDGMSIDYRTILSSELKTFHESRLSYIGQPRDISITEKDATAMKFKFFEGSDGEHYNKPAPKPQPKSNTSRATVERPAINRFERQLMERRRNAPPRRFSVSDGEFNGLIRKYGADLTARVQEFDHAPTIGREKELDHAVTVLLRKSRANPFFVGDAGVGKTKLFEGLAERIASGLVPPKLKGARVIEVDVLSMNAGAKYRGDFEERFEGVLRAVSERNEYARKYGGEYIILCMDEMHAAMRTGGAENGPGSGQLIKRFLNTGDLKIAGATTWDEYRKYIEKDPALNRRFEPVMIEEPTLEQTEEIVNGTVPVYEDHHHIDIPDAVAMDAIKLSNQYIAQNKQPGKSLDAIDTAAARAHKRGEERVRKDDVVHAVASVANLDPKFIAEGDEERYQKLDENLKERVYNQDEALDTIAASLRRAKTGLREGNKPLGAYLLMGPTGVGKTETAKALAELLFGTQDAMVRLDMSAYKEKHELARLLGAPPGYVGHGEDGELTGPIRKRPYSVLLLDEIEKAHPDVAKTLMSILEEGEVRDSMGRMTSFKNVILLATSNLGVKAINKLGNSIGFGDDEEENTPDKRKATYTHEIVKHFRGPEFLNRWDDVLAYESLSEDTIRKIALREIDKVSEFLRERHKNLTLEVSEGIIDALIEDGYNYDLGARPMKRLIESEIKTQIADLLLNTPKEKLAEKARIVFQDLSKAPKIKAAPKKTQKKAPVGAGSIPPKGPK